ncbi:MAG TPA: hypothetical protein VFS17_06320 [Methylophilaceae bacterium]|nr:hypothetical protein [Methylophilaceae bacterium]
MISATLSFSAWLFNLRRLLAISEYPTSTIAAAAQGYVELVGGARQMLPMKSPLQGRECVWYRYWVYAKDSNGIWCLQHYQSSEEAFEIEDATGRCRVDPQGAELIAAERHSKRQHDHHYIEELIPEGKSVYVLGQLQTISEAANAQQIRQEVGQLLAEWKKSSVSFLRRFDRDGNGEVDMDEWEQARAHARLEVLQQKGVLGGEEVQLIHAPMDGRLFLISGLSPYELRSRYKYWVALHLLFFLGAALLAYSQATGGL